MTAIRDARLSAHLRGFKGRRLAERARLERLAFYPSMSSAELYAVLTRLKAAEAALASPKTDQEARKAAWLLELMDDAFSAYKLATALALTP